MHIRQLKVLYFKMQIFLLLKIISFASVFFYFLYSKCENIFRNLDQLNIVLLLAMLSLI